MCIIRVLKRFSDGKYLFEREMQGKSKQFVGDMYDIQFQAQFLNNCKVIWIGDRASS